MQLHHEKMPVKHRCPVLAALLDRRAGHDWRHSNRLILRQAAASGAQTLRGRVSCSIWRSWNLGGSQTHQLTQTTVCCAMQQPHEHIPAKHGHPAGAGGVTKRECWSHNAAGT